MTDIFDTTILCKQCDKKMQPIIVNKSNAELRAIKCPKCSDQIIHPADLNCLEHFNNIKGKTYNVKLRMVGNSHAISIPKEIVNFMREQERVMDDMVKLHMEDMKKLSLNFGTREVW
jgi:DNA-directed RNA polymerase subunit RPC12/RpoP